ncbi:hypothetical protein M9Y10_025683 [Tritrichomonas musculus]|uniref:NADH:flavin oxidoreductase/NADH oxidase N-terminal domain-containing protein n=1 Tax=Tritrichomonas musculus TaxID=1915356 RepID=A0ABR2HAP2_9EUKA
MSGSVLFSPTKLGRLSVPNRFIRSATWESLADGDGRPTNELINMMENLAVGKVGLIIPGAVYVTKRGQGMKGQSGMCTIEQARDWHRGVVNIHKRGSKIIFQLIHNGLSANPQLNGGFPPSGPTAFNSNQHELTNTEIEDLIQDFADSAELSYHSSADGVQLHAAHGYLLSEFLSPALNKRTDKWGGSDDNRLRIVKEIIATIRKRVPEEFSISIKLNGNDYMENGIEPELCAKYVDKLKNDLDFFEISAGSHHTILSTINENVLTKGIKDPNKKKELIENAYKSTAGYTFKEMYNLDSLKIIRKAVPDAKLALVGGNRTFVNMEKLVNDGLADMISMSRPFLNDPYIVQRFQCKTLDHSFCINCSACVLNTENGVYCHLKKFLKNDR